jgi:hypothetical protein
VAVVAVVFDAGCLPLCSRRCFWLRLFAVWTVLSFFMLVFVLVGNVSFLFTLLFACFA